MKKPKITRGQAQKVQRLGDKANEYYRKARDHEGAFLIYAKRCGKELKAIYDTVGRWHFKRWVRRNFEGKSYETANLYINLCKHWEDPAIVTGRAKGIIRSLGAFRRVLRESKPEDQSAGKIVDEPETAESEALERRKETAAALRRYAKGYFAEAIKNLQIYELDILVTVFIEYFWPKWYRILRKAVCEAEGPYPKPERDVMGEPYGDSWEEHEAIKEAVRGKKKAKWVRKPLIP
jgi:hypothetical protein